jgi:hypothetical protein
LWHDGRSRFAAATKPQEYTAIHADLAMKIDQLDKDQATGFFSLGRGSIETRRSNEPSPPVGA